MNTARLGFGDKFKRQQGKKWGFWTFFLKRFFLKQKVPPAYSRAGENARSLTAVGMTTISKSKSAGSTEAHWNDDNFRA
jgi:hypothetical protein